jgi:hypothetical protein
MEAYEDDPVTVFAALPIRIYLDTSTLQALFDYGGLIWENEAPVLSSRAGRVQGFTDELEALRLTFQVNERAMFEFVVTAASLREVESKNDPRYTQWVYDVHDTWLIQSAGYPPRSSERPRIGSVSVKDWALLSDALDNACDAFLTMEVKLTTQADTIEKVTGLRIMRPTAFYKLLSPWAALFY